MFRPNRERRIKTSSVPERIPMVNKNRTKNLRRTTSIYDSSNPPQKNENSNERRRRHRVQQRSDTVDIV